MSAHAQATPMPSHTSLARRHRALRGFTLAELLVVIAIIVLLISILIPVIGKVRISGQSADTAAMIRAIDAACQTYYQDHQAWPGPLTDSQMGFDFVATNPIDSLVPVGGTAGDGFFRAPGTLTGVTAAENLVLGLLGGLVPDTANPGVVFYDPAAVGRGPVKLDPVRSPGSHNAYFDAREQDLSMHVIGDDDVVYLGLGSGNVGEKIGSFVDEGGAGRDSIVPEFVDRYSSPLPILYLRAAPTQRVTADEIGISAGFLVASDGSRPGIFDVRHIYGYVGNTGVGLERLGDGDVDEYWLNGAQETIPSPIDARGAQPPRHGLLISLPGIPNNNTAPAMLRNSMNKGDAAYTYPYDARAYLLSPDTANARQADRYVLISAGPDRIYGTEDDVTNFGSVK